VGRPDCLRLLVRTLYNQLAASLRETVAATEGVTPPNSIAELIAGRDWLFEGMSSYVDSTHLVSILRFAPDLEDPELLRMTLEMAEYGCRLSPMFHFRGDPPFEDVYLDHAVYLKALLGEDGDAAVEHFRKKLESARRATRRHDRICWCDSAASRKPSASRRISTGRNSPVVPGCRRAHTPLRPRGSGPTVWGFAAAVIRSPH
jgi:hypothetical protein